MAKKTSKKASASSRTTRQKLGRLAVRLALVALALGLVAAWMWQRTLPLKTVAVVGNVQAQAEDVIRLVRATPDSVALFALDPALMADRAERHPWVREAHIRRLPTGTLRIRVEERQPAALVLGADGRPAHFLDARGYAMPMRRGALADVPVLRGAVPEYHPTQPVDSRSLRELLAALASADAETDALISEIVWSPTKTTLWTTPTSSRATLPVRLGRTGQADQLRRLHAFWHQTVLPRPDVPIEAVDLRFEGQVVTKEADLPVSTVLASAVSTASP
ncbi:MAG: cell division protein FtsQ/DivIB [Rubricoccaceae bacterium]